MLIGSFQRRTWDVAESVSRALATLGLVLGTRERSSRREGTRRALTSISASIARLACDAWTSSERFSLRLARDVRELTVLEMDMGAAEEEGEEEEMVVGGKKETAGVNECHHLIMYFVTLTFRHAREHEARASQMLF